MIYFIITTCLFNNDEIRNSQYVKGIQTLIDYIETVQLSDYKIIIVENNGQKNMVLEQFSSKCTIIYTNNNKIQTYNKGLKELMDIFDCITLNHIQDEDFIVKITGRYIIQDNSEFIEQLKNIHKYDCIIRFGSFNEKKGITQCADCVTGLIGMRCKYVKCIRQPNVTTPVEWNWARATYLIPKHRICLLEKLGISIDPGCKTRYYIV